MDFIYTAGTYKDLANYMGLSDKTFQDQAAIAITTTSAGRAIIAAAIGNSGISNTDIDASTICFTVDCSLPYQFYGFKVPKLILFVDNF